MLVLTSHHLLVKKFGNMLWPRSKKILYFSTLKMAAAYGIPDATDEPARDWYDRRINLII